MAGSMTTAQPSLLDWQRSIGESRKRTGMASAVAHDRTRFLDVMRTHAVEVAQRNGSVTIDECRNYAKRIGAEPASPGVWGSVFPGGLFYDTGRTKRSDWPTSNRRKLTVWRLA